MIPIARFPAVVLILGVMVGFGLADDVPGTEGASQGTQPASPKTAAGVQFETGFSSATGASLTRTIGIDPQQEGDLDGMYSVFGSRPEKPSHSFTLRVTEDHTVSGPDGKPGVLRLQYVELPPKSSFSGFVMHGDQENGKIQMPGWTLGQLTLDDLRRTFIEFKFRADNPNDAADFGGRFLFRLEPDLPQSNQFLADFGTLIATQRWRTFRRPIGSANNLEAFLQAANEQVPPNFKFVWSQNDGYNAGESLLIDDLKIVIE